MAVINVVRRKKVSKALSFDGVDDYVDVGNPSSLQITGDLTIVWWFKPTNIGKGRQNPIDKAYGGEFAFTLEPDGGLSYYHGSAGKEGGPYWNKYKAWPAGTFKDNTWYFVAFVRNAETRTAWGYVDGNLVWTDSWSSDVDPSVSSEPVTIGKGYAGTFQGIIDEVRIYNRALSEEEIKLLYQKGPGYDGVKEGLVLWHDYGTGTLADRSGNGNDGTAYGDPTWTDGGYIEYDLTDRLSGFDIVREMEKAVDVAELSFARTEIDIGDEIIIEDTNGNKLFAGTVEDVEKKGGVKARVYSYGYILNNVYVEEVYYNTPPEQIVADLISKYTDLNPVVRTSGITFKRWIARGYLNNEIAKIVRILDWQIRTDEDRNFYFEPKGAKTLDVVLKVGENIPKPQWRKVTDTLFNSIRLEGGEVLLSTKETFTGDGSTKTFALTYKPVSVRILVDGTEKKGGQEGESGIDYYVREESREIVFTTAPASGSSIEVFYSFFKPIIIEAQDKESIAQYGVKSKVITAKWVKDYAMARRVARQYLSVFSKPGYVGIVECGWNLLSSLKPGAKVRIVDDIEGIDDYFVIKKMKIAYPKGKIELNVGRFMFNVLDWQAKVQERIKELEKQLTSTEKLSKYLFFKTRVKIGLSA